MNYVSTRGGTTANDHLHSADAIKQGLCSDGGLFMPSEIPLISKYDMVKLSTMPYADRAAWIMTKFLTDYDYETLRADCADAYSETRFPGGAAPLVKLDETNRVLELWHGPTCAFKDMALQIMPKLLSRSLSITGEEKNAFILVATSGDTGKAALEGYKDIDRIRIMVYYPVDGVSDMQKRQMATQEGNNVSVCAIRGNFDDAQNGVKAIFADATAAAELAKSGQFFSSANSINWGRLVPQIVYYFSAYADLLKRGEVLIGDPINVCVPTGNFGNIFAACLAKQMGLPVAKFICASNQNNILTDFFNTGTYDRNRQFFTTVSPSMDILISSNLERYLYLKAGAAATADYMKSLKDTGKYTVSSTLLTDIQKEICGYYCNESETLATIHDTYHAHRYLIDTHTAVAVHCAKAYQAETGDMTKTVIVSTASPYKFASNVLHALTDDVPADDFEAVEALSAMTGTDVPAPLAALRRKTVRFDTVISPEDMRKQTLETAAKN